MYLAGARLLESAGLLQYEVSSFGRMGHYSQHHLGLWEGRDHLGLGPSSTSTVQGRRWTNPSELRLWRHVLRTGTLGVDAHALAPAQRARELVRLRLRTSRGLRLRGFRRLTGRDLLADHAALVATLRRHGLARVERGYLRLTRAGMLVSEVILDHVLPPAAATTPIRRRAADRSHADSA
jgi:oxygen-independent coproporphyrinogen-3 oxidase